jgi:hypothetical protein
MTRVVGEAKQKCRFRIRHLLLKTQPTECYDRHTGKPGHGFEELTVEVQVD